MDTACQQTLFAAIKVAVNVMPVARNAANYHQIVQTQKSVCLKKYTSELYYCTFML